MEIDFKQVMEFLQQMKLETVSLQTQLDYKNKEIEILKTKLKTIREVIMNTNPEKNSAYPISKKSRVPNWKRYVKEWLAPAEAKPMFNDMMDDNFVVTPKNLKILNIENSTSLYTQFKKYYSDKHYGSKKNSDELLQKYKERIACGYYKIYKESA